MNKYSITILMFACYVAGVAVGFYVVPADYNFINDLLTGGIVVAVTLTAHWYLTRKPKS